MGNPHQRTHALDQYMALALEVQSMLLAHKEHLIRVGWSEPEAWALCQRIEERVMGPAMDMAETRLSLEARMDAFLAEEMERRRPKP